MTAFARIALVPMAALLVSATSSARVIPLPKGEGEALVVPVNSPVRFRGFGRYDVARFAGRFVLTGTFIYGCEIECEPPLQADEVFVRIVPDAASAGVLPRWKFRNGNMRIYLVGGERLAQAIVTPREKAALLAGKVEDVRKQVAFVVDDYSAGIECDSASYSARYVALAKPVRLASAKVEGDFGCG
jgi:hypothetical protein